MEPTGAYPPEKAAELKRLAKEKTAANEAAAAEAEAAEGAASKAESNESTGKACRKSRKGRRIMAFKISDLDDTQAPLMEHLMELRGRLVRAVAAFAVAFAVCLYFADDIFGILVRPLTASFAEGQGRLVYTQLYGAFFVEIKVAMFAAFFVSFPIIANQLWAFIAPGLYAREKRAFLPFLIATPVLFTLGACLAYFVVMPLAFPWFLGFQGNVGGIDAEALPEMGEYLDLVMRFILAFGISFLLPVLLMLLNRAGLVSRDQLVVARANMWSCWWWRSRRSSPRPT